ncbi:MAG: APC family permease [Balneolaceae bacterium]|nr:APC family permease [Balneolaceae bacterium]
MSAENRDKLNLLEAIGIAIGGMVGGGIFVVLGEAVIVAGNATFLSLGLGGLLALITGVNYSKLTAEYHEPGGEFTFIEHIAGIRFAGTVSWLLIFGYVFAISLYAYIFGAYAGRLLGLGSAPNNWLAGGILIASTFFLSTGLRQDKATVHYITVAKFLILASLILIGFFTVDPEKALPIVDHRFNNVIFGAALVFVGYEGFQLIIYQFDRIENYQKNLRRALFLSILIVTCVYVLIAFVLTGSLSKETIIHHKETVLAMLAKPLFGNFGISAILTAVIFSTSTAVTSTLSAVSDLAVRISDDGQLPHQLTDYRAGDNPLIFTALIACSGLVIVSTGTLREITAFSSLLFLFIFSVVNYMGFVHRVHSGWKRFIPLIGSIACFAAMSILIYDIYLTDQSFFYIILSITALILLLRLSFTLFHTKYKGRDDTEP